LRIAFITATENGTLKRTGIEVEFGLGRTTWNRIARFLD